VSIEKIKVLDAFQNCGVTNTLPVIMGVIWMGQGFRVLTNLLDILIFFYFGFGVCLLVMI